MKPDRETKDCLSALWLLITLKITSIFKTKPMTAKEKLQERIDHHKNKRTTCVDILNDLHDSEISDCVYEIKWRKVVIDELEKAIKLL